MQINSFLGEVKKKENLVEPSLKYIYLFFSRQIKNYIFHKTYNNLSNQPSENFNFLKKKVKKIMVLTYFNISSQGLQHICKEQVNVRTLKRVSKLKAHYPIQHGTFEI